MSNATSTRKINPMRLGRKMKPTQKHRPAVWEGMLGTVYAMNEDREVRYFDYKWDEAMEFAGVTQDGDFADRDLRVARKTERVSYSRTGSTLDEPRHRQWVLWIKKEG